MQPHALLGETPSQAVTRLRKQTEELPDDKVFERKKEYIDTAQRYGLEEHTEALEEAYWEDLKRKAKESYTADKQPVKEALYWHETRGLFGELDVKDLAHHNLSLRSAYQKLAEELDATGRIHTTDEDLTYHFLDPDEVHQYTTDDHDLEHVRAEVQDLQETLPFTG